MDSFKFLVRQGWRSMSANKAMTTAGVGVLSVCLIITGIAALVSLNVNKVVDFLGQQNEIVVYILDGTTQEDQQIMEQQIKAVSNVATVEYVSKEEAMLQMQEWMEKYDYLFDGYEEILPASYRVTVTDLNEISQTNAAISTLANVESTTVPLELADVMVFIKNVVNYGGWGMVAVLAIVALIVIGNTIRLAVFNRRREINIMKYVGATNNFIRLPFFVEGTTIGLISGIIASVVVGGGYFALMELVKQTNMLWAAGIISQLYTFYQVIPFIVVGFLLFGVVIGGVATASSIRKHLSV